MDTFVTTTDSFETEYAEQGAAQPLVLLHGWGGTKRLWRRLWPAMVSRWRVIAPDLPGWGGSGKPEDAPYTPEWYARWLRAFLDARDARRVDIVAHSMGTMVAAHFASEQPDRVRRLVLSNPPVVGATGFGRRTYRLTKPLSRWVLHKLLGLRGVRRWATRDFTYAVPWDDEDVDNIRRSTYASMCRTVDAMVASDVTQVLSGLRMPVLVVGTTMDAVVKPEQASLAARTIPHAELVTIDDCGHCPMIEKPEAFTRAVVEFLSKDLPKVRPRQW